ncbi:hypothetical protein C8Q80DRAFT_219928 [Daedaleopsis nitida]|nr:hypothetical protein C8Q80DRAFT_219928 [Daedaleopsis nitida]
MYVFNWKTGKTIWEVGICEEDKYGQYKQYADTRCRIVDAAYVLKISKSDIFVYDITPGRQSDDSDYDMTGSPICQLQLPLLAAGYRVYDIDCYVHRPPSSHCLPHFECDPDLTVLVLEDEVCGRHEDNTKVVIFVPLSLIRKVADRCRTSRGSGSTTTPCNSPPPKSVSWDEWAEHGARLILLSRDSGYAAVSTLGSRVTLTFEHIVPQQQPHNDSEVFLFDVHPHARAMLEHALEAPGMAQRMSVSDCFTATDAPIFQGPVRSTLPYRVTRKVVPNRVCYGIVHVLQDGLGVDFDH